MEDDDADPSMTIGATSSNGANTKKRSNGTKLPPRRYWFLENWSFANRPKVPKCGFTSFNREKCFPEKARKNKLARIEPFWSFRVKKKQLLHVVLP